MLQFPRLEDGEEGDLDQSISVDEEW